MTTLPHAPTYPVETENGYLDIQDQRFTAYPSHHHTPQATWSDPKLTNQKHPTKTRHPNFFSNFLNMPETPRSSRPAFSSNFPLGSFLGAWCAAASPAVGR